MRDLEDELYAIATLMFSIFIPGMMPYVRKRENIWQKEERVFAFPDGYLDNKNKVHHGFELLWFMLSNRMREYFLNTFQNKRFPSIEEWEDCICEYLNLMKNGEKRTVIYPPLEDGEKKTIRFRSPEIILEGQPGRLGSGYSEIGIRNDNKKATLFVEFGATGLRLRCTQSDFIPGSRSKISTKLVRKANIDFLNLVDEEGCMSIQLLDQYLAGEDCKQLYEVYKKMLKTKPAYTELHAYGLSFLRNLTNRTAVINKLKEKTGFDFFVYTSEEEAKLRVSGLNQAYGEPVLLLQLCTTSLLLVLSAPGINIVSHEMTNLGSRLMINMFLSTRMPSDNLDNAFEEHDLAIKKQIESFVEDIKYQIKNLKFKRLKVLLIGFEFFDFNRLIDSGITDYHEDLNRVLLENREHVEDLADDWKNDRNKVIENRFIARLTIPIISILLKTGIPMQISEYNEQKVFCVSAINSKYNISI